MTATRRKQAPLRSCGQCARSFRSWGEKKLCGRCTEDGARRPKPTRLSAQMSGPLPGTTWEHAFGSAVTDDGGIVCRVDESCGQRELLLFGPEVASRGGEA